MTFINWLTKLILEFLWGVTVGVVQDYIARRKARETTEKNAKKLEETLAKEGVTDEEIKKESQDLLNGNRP